MTKLREQVREFHKMIGQADATTPGVPSDEIARLRCLLVLEEAFEFAEAHFAAGGSTQLKNIREDAFGIIRHATLDPNLPAIADALADVDYVVEGSRLAYGIDGDPVADEVHRSNMTKAGGPISPEGKRLKPPGWTPPDVARELRKQGWKP